MVLGMSFPWLEKSQQSQYIWQTKLVSIVSIHIGSQQSITHSHTYIFIWTQPHTLSLVLKIYPFIYGHIAYFEYSNFRFDCSCLLFVYSEHVWNCSHPPDTFCSQWLRHSVTGICTYIHTYVHMHLNVSAICMLTSNSYLIWYTQSLPLSLSLSAGTPTHTQKKYFPALFSQNMLL